jgi:hypothetical protein
MDIGFVGLLLAHFETQHIDLFAHLNELRENRYNRARIFSANLGTRLSIRRARAETITGSSMLAK